MKKLLILFLIVLTVGLQVEAKEASLTKRAKCESLKDFADDYNKQLPMKADFVTTITGFKAAENYGRCSAEISYLIDEDIMIDAWMKGSGLSKAGTLTYVYSDQGKEKITNYLKQQLLQSPFGKDTDIHVTAVYKFTGSLETLYIHE